ncbi:Uncharacterised protein [Lysinibacillus sphaericus]|nr:Uncharacterised protein [Lysinibacillus sphaericus]
MENVITKLNQWLMDEMEVSSELAFEVANAETVDEMVKAKSAYQIQNATTQAIGEAIRLVEETAKKETV